MEDSKKRSISSFEFTKKKVLKIIGKNLAKDKVLETYPKLTWYLFEIVHKGKYTFFLNYLKNASLCVDLW